MEYTKIKKIHVAEAGTLSTLLPTEEAGQLEVLILSGYLNTKDFEVLDDLCTFWGMEYDEDDNPVFDWDEAPKLRVLDMGDCELVDSTVLPEFGFHMPLDKIVLPKNIEELSLDSAIEGSFLREIVLPPTMTYLYGINNCERLEHIEIPESVDCIGRYALSGCPKLKELYIPKNVKDIHGGLLAGDKLIKEITVSEENQHFVSIDGVVYTRDLKTLVAYPCGSGRKVYKVLEGTEELGMGAFMESDIEEIILPESLTSIGDSCFYFCEKLRQLIMPDSVTKLGFRSLAYCWCLEHLHLSTSLETIESQTFNGCVSLKRLDVPGSVKTIDASAIAWNEEGFEEIILHEGVEEITAEHGKNSFMFAKQSVLRKIYIPSTLKYLTTGMFSNCTDLESLVVSENNPYFKTVDGAIYTKDGKELVAVPDWSRENFSIAEGTEIIGEGCFWQFCRLRKIHIPSTVRIIESRAFDSCSSLKEICFPESLEEIGERTFDTCDRLTTIKIFAKQPPMISGDENHNLILFCEREVDILVPAESVSLYLSDSKWRKWNIKAMA
ncbi:MAG: leucine-rich repeat domain-containing protein [Prevotella sp.]